MNTFDRKGAKATAWRWFGCAILAILFNFAATPASAQTASSLVGNIFHTAWKVSPDDYASAQKLYQQARGISPNDVRVPYAMALVAIKNHSNTDAAKYFDEAVANGNTLYPIRRVKMWFEIGRKDRAAAAADARALAKLLAVAVSPSKTAVSTKNTDTTQDLTATVVPTDDELQTAKWIGTVLGYYAGPGNRDMPAAELAKLESDLFATLSPQLAQAVNEGKKSLAEQAGPLEQKWTAAVENAKLTNASNLEARREKNKSALDDANNKLEHSKQALVDLRQMYNADELEQNVSSLRSQIAVLASRRDAMKRQIDKEKQDAKDDDKDKDKNKSSNSADIKHDEDELERINASGKQLEAQLTPLAKRLNQMQSQATPLLREVEKQQPIVKAESRLAKQLEKPAPTSDAASLALEASYHSFNTYAGIDLDKERQRILNSYGLK